MENLPERCVWFVCRYLTDQELAFCTAVCKSWRCLFDKDAIWEGRSNECVDRYLSTTASVVEPIFTVPDGSLDPPCHWRLANMREKHLWSNWTQGRTKDIEVLRKVSSSESAFPKKWGFVTDDFVYIAFEKTLQVWNIREDIATKVFENVHRLSLQELSSFTVVGEGRDVAIANERFRVKVFSIDTTVGSITEKYAFDLCTDINVRFRDNVHRFKLNYAVLGPLLIGIVTGASRQIHIWNLKTQAKVKEDPIEMCSSRYVVEIKSSKSSDAIAVVTAPHTQQHVVKSFATYFDRSTFFYFVYCPKRQVFYDFKQHSLLTNSYDCATLKQFIAIIDSASFRVFNYRTSELIFQGAGGFAFLLDCSTVSAIGSRFCYPGGFFDPVNKTQITSRSSMMTGLLEKVQHLDQLSALRKYCWEIRSSVGSTPGKFVQFNEEIGESDLSLAFEHSDYIDVNSCCTKIVYLHGVKSIVDIINASIEDDNRSVVTVRIKQLW